MKIYYYPEHHPSAKEEAFHTGFMDALVYIETQQQPVIEYEEGTPEREMYELGFDAAFNS